MMLDLSMTFLRFEYGLYYKNRTCRCLFVVHVFLGTGILLILKGTKLIILIRRKKNILSIYYTI